MDLFFANSVLFIIFNILFPPLICTKVSKVQTNITDRKSRSLPRNISIGREIVPSGTKSCTEKNDTGTNIAEIKEIAVKLLEKVNELEKFNNMSMTMSTSATTVSSALTKEHTSSIVTSTLPVSTPATSTTIKSVSTSAPLDHMTTSMEAVTPLTKTDKPASFTTTGGTSQTNCTSLPPEEEKQTPLHTTESAAGKRDGFRTRMWDPWTAWSCCSVTCGKGRQVRWRHCIADKCPVADAEMEEKTCQMPACASSKFFGIF